MPRSSGRGMRRRTSSRWIRRPLSLPTRAGRRHTGRRRGPNVLSCGRIADVPKRRRSSPELLAALAPASGHLLAAAVELIAAAREALDVLTEDGSGLPAKSIEAL